MAAAARGRKGTICVCVWCVLRAAYRRRLRRRSGGHCRRGCVRRCWARARPLRRRRATPQRRPRRRRRWPRTLRASQPPLPRHLLVRRTLARLSRRRRHRRPPRPRFALRLGGAMWGSANPAHRGRYNTARRSSAAATQCLLQGLYWHSVNACLAVVTEVPGGKESGVTVLGACAWRPAL